MIPIIWHSLYHFSVIFICFSFSCQHSAVSCHHVSMSSYQHVSMSICQHVSMSACHHVIMSVCQHVSMSACQHVSMSACQHVSMSACQRDHPEPAVDAKSYFFGNRVQQNWFLGLSGDLDADPNLQRVDEMFMSKQETKKKCKSAWLWFLSQSWGRAHFSLVMF